MKRTESTVTSIEQVAQTRYCLTCAYRRFHAPSTRLPEPSFEVFYCGAAWKTGRDLVKPDGVCEHWQHVTIGVQP